MAVWNPNTSSISSNNNNNDDNDVEKAGIVFNATLQPLFFHGQRKWSDPKCPYFVIFRSLPIKTKSAELN